MIDLEKTLFRGFWAFVFITCVAFLWIAIILTAPSQGFFSKEKKESLSIPQVYEPQLRIVEKQIPFPCPPLQSELILSQMPPMPNSLDSTETLFLALKKGGAKRKVRLLEKIGLSYDSISGLGFVEETDLFWLTIVKEKEGFFRASIFISRSPGSEEIVGSFPLSLESIAVKTEGVFPQDSSWKIVEQGKWIGPDLFVKKYGQNPCLRLDIGRVFSFMQDDVISMGEENLYTLVDHQEKNMIKLHSFDEKGAVFHVWIKGEYARFFLPQAPPSPWKIKAEEFLSAIRIRSEKEIRCMLDRQYFVLRVGDWVFKPDTRWKQLRDPQDRQAYLDGKLKGEIFVLEKIETKGGQKMICGSLWNALHSQYLPIEIAVAPLHSEKKRK